MKIYGGETLIVKIGNEEQRWKVSSVDSRVVKLFEQDGRYRQIPYSSLQEMINRGCVKIENNPLP